MATRHLETSSDAWERGQTSTGLNGPVKRASITVHNVCVQTQNCVWLVWVRAGLRGREREGEREGGREGAREGRRERESLQWGVNR